MSVRTVAEASAILAVGNQQILSTQPLPLYFKDNGTATIYIGRFIKAKLNTLSCFFKVVSPKLQTERRVIL